MNKVILTGRITKDLEMKYTTTNNTAVVTFNLAVRKTKTDADFVQIVAYGKTAELLCQYCKKGSSICIVGHIRTRNYEDKDGKTVYVTEIIADEIEFGSYNKEQNNPQLNDNQETINDEDLPF